MGPRMKILFVGGTGFISTAVSRLAVARGWELFLLNRGQRHPNPPGCRSLVADINRAEEVRAAMGDMRFDVIVDWVAYAPPDIERDLALFRGRAGQYIFISSASAYQKPPAHYVITESTPLHNPHWEYSRNKIACEERLMRAFREEGFPVTIVRPSLTYDPQLPIALGGWGCYTLCDRLKAGRPIIIHGDGSSLWVVTHAEDFGRGLLGLFGNPAALGHAFHITSVGRIAQLVEQRTENPCVAGSIPAPATTSTQPQSPDCPSWSFTSHSINSLDSIMSSNLPQLVKNEKPTVGF
jgi:nucleoside-diphosphate-sugar epimerase